jgi:hypothetical protein
MRSHDLYISMKLSFLDKSRRTVNELLHDIAGFFRSRGQGAVVHGFCLRIREKAGLPCHSPTGQERLTGAVSPSTADVMVSINRVILLR